MLLDISPDVPHIKKSIRYEMQHLMQIDELQKSDRRGAGRSPTVHLRTVIKSSNMVEFYIVGKRI